MPETTPSQSPKPVDAVLDEMLEETFSASDPPQLDGLPLKGQPPIPRPPRQHAPPPDVLGPQPDEATAFDRPESTYPLGGAASVTLQTRGGQVEMRLSDNPLTLDTAALSN